MRTFMVGAALVALAASPVAAQEKAAAYDAERCVNLGNSLETPKGENWGGRRMRVDDLERIKAAGFDTVRIPVRWSDYAAQEPPYTIQPDFMEEVETIVDAALDMGFNVVLNVHHYEEMMRDPRGHARRLIGLWRQIAPHFADRSDNLWFETLNEPNGELTGKLMQQVQAASVAAIRESNPDRIVILMGEDWSGIRSLGSNIAPPDDNIVYSFHYYDPFSFTHQKAEWLGDAMPKGTRGWGSKADRQELARATETAATFAEATGHPVFLGEVGVNSPVKNKERVKYLGAVTKAMSEKGIAWCIWSYANTFALYEDGKGWDKDALEALGLTAE
ncbi:glycoside hydrolase family 5 protein [Parvularcula lutaonensis]|uniref:Glycoside hydrolase family 5 protein n=1 Tax=Parvularcula lutaonensis TaxID=491923 RepID=A0ABV7MCN2_9PROT|nr:glycoside hydrolase family 5 protein [Parvularcula lutaonensis]GGY39128.1 endoglucanase [Parvularcula lutaonensis]